MKSNPLPLGRGIFQKHPTAQVKGIFWRVLLTSPKHIQISGVIGCYWDHWHPPKKTKTFAPKNRTTQNGVDLSSMCFWISILLLFGGCKMQLKSCQQLGGQSTPSNQPTTPTGHCTKRSDSKVRSRELHASGFPFFPARKSLGRQGGYGNDHLCILGGTIRLYLYRYTVLYPCSTEP